MTTVVLAPRLEDPTSAVEPIIGAGWMYRLRPSKNYVAGGQWVLAQWPVGGGWKAFTGSSVNLDLDALPGNPYLLEMRTAAGRDSVSISEYRIVTDSGSPLNWWDLEQVSNPAGDPLPTSTVEARLTALETALGGVSGGASNLASITDMSAFMRTVNDDTSASAARATLGAGTSSLVIGTSSGNAADGAVAAATAATATTAASNATTALANAAAAQSTASAAQATATAAQSAANSKITYPAGGIEGAVLIKSGVGAEWSVVSIADLVASLVVNLISYSTTPPTGSATNGEWVLGPTS